MTRDIHALSGAYAVDALDDLERAEFEDHLAECGSCRDEVDSLREAAAVLAETAPVAPPLSLRDSVLAGITSIRPLPPLPRPEEADVAPAASVPVDVPPTAPVVGATVTPLARPRRRTALLAVAAAAVVVAGVGVAVAQPWTDDASSQVELSLTDRVIRADDAERVEHRLDGDAVLTVVRSRALDRAVILTENLPPAPQGHSYELWLERDELMIPAGHLAGGTTSSTVLLEGPASVASAVGVTIEEAGTEPESPQGPIVAVIPFDEA